MSDEAPPPDSEEDSEDFRYVTEKYGRNFLVDTRRYFDSRLRDITQRPLDSLEENAQFEELRSSPWKLELARQMTYFARSNDPLGDPWPYERFLAKLEAAGISLPPDLSIRDAVGEVSTDLERMSMPKTPGARASGTWFEKNIARPLSEKLAAVSQGAPSQDQLTATDSGAPQIHSPNAPTGSASTSAWADWLRGRTTDLDLETLSVLHLDMLRAPDVLARKLADAAGDPAHESASDGPCPAESSEDHVAHAQHQDVVRAAYAFAKAVTTQVQTIDDLRTWLRVHSDGWGQSDEESGSVGPQALMADMLLKALNSTGVNVHDERYAEHLSSVIRIYAEALGFRPSRPT